MALILNQTFPGLALAKALLLLPWAAPLAIIGHDLALDLPRPTRRVELPAPPDRHHQQNIVWLGRADLAFGAVMFVEVWSSIPFMTITFLAGLQSIPPHIYDAAKMDGANPWHELWDMTVPQMKKIFTIVTLLSVIWAFRSFTVIWTMTQGNPFYRTDISVTYLYKLAFKNLTFGQGFALAFVTFLLLVVFSVLYTRVLRSEEGMTMERTDWIKWLAIVFFLIPMLLILLFPFIVMISTSFKTLQEVSQIPPTFIPTAAHAGQLPRGLEHHPAWPSTSATASSWASARRCWSCSWASRQLIRCAGSVSPAAGRI